MTPARRGPARRSKRALRVAGEHRRAGGRELGLGQHGGRARGSRRTAPPRAPCRPANGSRNTVVGLAPPTPNQRSRVTGWSIRPITGASSCSTAISVVNSGRPVMKARVPSIGSSTQRQRAPAGPVSPASSPRIASAGCRAAITARIAASAARSARVTGLRSSLSSSPGSSTRKNGRIASPAALAASSAVSRRSPSATALSATALSATALSATALSATALSARAPAARALGGVAPSGMAPSGMAPSGVVLEGWTPARGAAVATAPVELGPLNAPVPACAGRRSRRRGSSRRRPRDSTSSCRPRTRSGS